MFDRRRLYVDLACPSLGPLRTGTRTTVLGIPTRDTHITSDMCAGIHISRGYTYHCDTGTKSALLAWE